MPGLTVHHQLPEPAQTHVHRVTDANPNILSSVVPFSSHLQSFCIRVFSNESVLCIRWPKYQSFSFSISPSNEYSGLISFRRALFYLLAVQGSLLILQFKSINSSALSFLCSPTLRSIHNYWKNHSFGYMDLC